MTNQFLRRILPKIHKKITDQLQGEPIKLFFEEESHVWEYETISGDLMESLALTTEQVDLIMGTLYANLRDTPEEYASVEKFKKPSKVTYHIDKDEIWSARQTYSYKVDAYFPIMAGLEVNEDNDMNWFAEDVEWISHEDTSLDFRGPV